MTAGIVNVEIGSVGASLIGGGRTNLTASGACDPSAVSGTPNDWSIHEQGLDFTWTRFQEYGNTTANTTLTASSSHPSMNYVECVVNAWTNDTVMYNAVYPSCTQTMQDINYLASGACTGTGGTSGLGRQGGAFTVVVGNIRKLSTKDALGNITDPSGYDYFHNHSVITNKAPGLYACDSPYDTSTAAIRSVNDVATYAANMLPHFNLNLVKV